MESPSAGHEPPIVSPLATAIVQAVYSYRFLASPQVSKLFSHDGRAAELILKRLAAAGYLAGIKRPILDSDTPDTIYALAQRGADLIASELGIDRRAVRWRKYHNYVGLPFVDHRLAVNDVRIAFTVGARRWGYSIQAWWYELPIREDVDDPDEKAPPLILRPDAYFRLLDNQRRLHLFLEVDMGTESHVRFGAKIRRYLTYKESRMFRTRFGGRSFRVLIVAPTLTRARALRHVTEGQGGERMFWFASLTDVTAERITEPVWELAGMRGAKAGLFSSAGCADG
jgi:hypothetical protein